MSATLASAFDPRAAATTIAPCAASVFAIAAPMPRDAPVTSATFPDRSNIYVANTASARASRSSGAPTDATVASR